MAHVFLGEWLRAWTAHPDFMVWLAGWGLPTDRENVVGISVEKIPDAERSDDAIRSVPAALRTTLDIWVPQQSAALRVTIPGAPPASCWPPEALGVLQP